MSAVKMSREMRDLGFKNARNQDSLIYDQYHFKLEEKTIKPVIKVSFVNFPFTQIELLFFHVIIYF